MPSDGHAARLADALERYAEDGRGWWRLAGADGLLMQAWRSESGGGDAWSRAYAAALESQPVLLRHAATLGAPVDGSRLHRNLCGLIAARRHDPEAAAAHVGPGQAEVWLAQARGSLAVEREVRAAVGLLFHADHGEIADLHLARVHAPRAGLWEGCDAALLPLGTALLSTLYACAPQDGTVVWSLRPRGRSLHELPLDGTSCGGALRLGLRVLRTRLAYDPGCLVVADRSFQRVAGEAAKIDAAVRDGSIRRVLVGAGSTSVREVVGHGAGRVTVHEVGTEEEALALATHGIDASGEPCRPDDPFYVAPAALDSARRVLRHEPPSRLLTICGPRRSGKTSLVRRLQAEAAAEGRRLGVVSLDQLQRLALESPDLFFREFTSLVVEALGGPPLAETDWRPLSTNAQNCRTQVEKHLDPARPVTLIIDQADSMLESPVKDDFYRMLRTWFNQASESNARGAKWRSCGLVLLISADPNQFITTGSPFNVGSQGRLEPLRADEVAALMRDAGFAPGDAPVVHAVTGGWPYLVRVALAAGPALDVATLSACAHLPSSPFAPWLEGLEAEILRRWPDADAYMRQLREGQNVRGDVSPDVKLARYRLIRLGLIEDGPVERWSCDLYRRFFGGRRS